MENNITELVFILDRSGSMAGLTDDTIGGFNAMLEKQKKEEGVCYVSTVLFSNESRVLHDRVPIAEVPVMTEKDYTAGGCTALLDALGSAIRHISNIHRYIREEDVPQRTVFVITTDGMENASRRYSAEEVKEMIERKQKKYGWEFLFLAANIDAVESAVRYGISRDRAVNYHADGQGTELVYEAVGSAVSSLRTSRVLRDDWAKPVRDDYAQRKRKK